MNADGPKEKNALRIVALIILLAALFLVAGFARLADLAQKNRDSSSRNAPANTVFPPPGFRGPTGPPHTTEPSGPPPNY